MKRRKILGLILLIGTLVYLLASLLAFYQNQRIKIEKGIEETLKAYSDKEEQEVKELSKDFDLLLDEKLDEKLDVNDMNQHILKYDGSFARIDKNVSKVTDELAVAEYNINNLNGKMEQIENYYNTLYEEVASLNTTYEERIEEINNTTANLKGDMEQIENYYNTLYEEFVSLNTTYEEKIEEINNTTANLKGDIENIKIQVSEIKNLIEENNLKQNENVKLLQEQIAVYEKRLAELEGSILYYQYDSETHTLNIYGNREGEQESEQD